MTKQMTIIWMMTQGLRKRVLKMVDIPSILWLAKYSSNNYGLRKGVILLRRNVK